MAVETAADLLDFLTVDDWAVSATYTPAGAGSATVLGIFDNPQAGRNASQMLDITVPQPSFMCRTADVPTAADGDTLEVGGIIYTIRVVLTDGVGMSTLFLEAP